MPEKINWTLNVQVVGGPKISASDPLEVEAYDKIEAVIPAGGSATVNVQPGTGAQFLLITASSYAKYDLRGGRQRHHRDSGRPPCADWCGGCRPAREHPEPVRVQQRGRRGCDR